jgi:predicted ABC-type exoprotein transport system permease subunit
MIVFIQIAWALLCTAWNGYGLWLISKGQKPIGPTASATLAFVCIGFAILFWFFHRRHLKWPYLILSGLTAIMASYAVYGAFTQDHSLWPSETWRWLGIILNGSGAVAGILAIIKSFQPNKEL